MELVKSYIYNSAPLQTDKIDHESLWNLLSDGWYEDIRSGDRFAVYNRRYHVGEQWYRVVIQLERMAGGFLNLAMPLPFLVAECVTENELTFKDTKAYHGVRLKSTIGMIEAGVPMELIDRIIEDLKRVIVYIGEDRPRWEPTRNLDYFMQEIILD